MKTTLVSALELAANPQWRVFDCRSDLAQPGLGAAQYVQAHIPGALHAHLDHDLSGPKTGKNGRHPLPERRAFIDWLERQGLRAGAQVVAYDASGGPYAARLRWLLRWVGHEAVAILDGGFNEWTRQGLPVDRETPRFERTRYVAEPGAVSMPVVDTAAVLGNIAAPTAIVLDARAAGRYAGVGETIDPVAGHIPGARNRPFTDNLDPAGLFKSPDKLRAEYVSLLAAPPVHGVTGSSVGDVGGASVRSMPDVISQCGSGVTACHNIFAMHLAGLADGGIARQISLYPGSWSEWVSDPSRPISTGAQP